MRTMKCAVFHEPKKMTVQQKELRDIGPDEVAIRVHACGICGTDIHLYLGETTYASPPVILGHEFAGEVVEVGDDVSTIKVGDRATAEPNFECGLCALCRADKQRICPNNLPYGINKDGGFAEYFIGREGNIHRVPDHVPFEEAAFAEPVSNVVHGLDLAGITPGTSVAVVGGGPSGMVYLQMAKRAGASPLILITRSEWKVDLARQFGADVTISPAKGAAKKAVLDLTDGVGCDVVIEAVGSGKAVEASYELVGAGGKVLVFGVAPEKDTFSLPPFDFLTREISLQAVWLNPGCFGRAIDVLAKGLIDVRSLATHTFGLDDIADGFDVMIEKPEGFIKALITP
jgi:threonine dehydrogenase-like Zn-dependent dehydrogenase